VNTYRATEHWRRTCEARHVIRSYDNGTDRQAYIDRIEKKRGKPAAAMLKADLIAEIQARKHGWMVFPYVRAPRLTADSQEWSNEYGYNDKTKRT